MANPIYTPLRACLENLKPTLPITMDDVKDVFAICKPLVPGPEFKLEVTLSLQSDEPDPHSIIVRLYSLEYEIVFERCLSAT